MSGSRQPEPPAEELDLDASDPIVCFCNEVRLSVIVDALEGGATTLPELFDRTWAGCGPCGGSCQPDLQALLDDWAAP